MFNKTTNNDSADSDARVAPSLEQEAKPKKTGEFQLRSLSYIGPTLEFTGDVVVDEGLVIEGIVHGTVRSKAEQLTVGKKGRVDGELHAHVVEVRGTVRGDIYGYDVVRLCATSVVDGTVHGTKIIMDEGAELNGTVDMKMERNNPARSVLKSVDAKLDCVAKVVS